jgi:hypothetical protein
MYFLWGLLNVYFSLMSFADNEWQNCCGCIKRVILLSCRLQSGWNGGNRLSFTYGFGMKEI